jgi:hypothetical protein
MLTLLGWHPNAPHKAKPDAKSNTRAPAAYSVS